MPSRVSGCTDLNFLAHRETSGTIGSCSRPTPFPRKSPSMNFKTAAALIGTLALPFAVMAQNLTTVNGKPVPQARVDALIKTATHGQEAPPELKAQAKDQVVMREIFAQAAEK